MVDTSQKWDNLNTTKAQTNRIKKGWLTTLKEKDSPAGNYKLWFQHQNPGTNTPSSTSLCPIPVGLNHSLVEGLQFFLPTNHNKYTYMYVLYKK